MDIKYVECDDCGVIFNDIDDLDIIHRVETFGEGLYKLKDYENKRHSKILCCPYCGNTDALKFIIKEKESDKLFDWDIKIYSAFNSVTNYYIALVHDECKVCILSDEKDMAISFDILEEAKEEAIKIKKNILKEIFDENKNTIKMIKNLHKYSKEVDLKKLHSIENYEICYDCGKRIDTDKDTYYVRNNTDTGGSEIVCEKCARR